MQQESPRAPDTWGRLKSCIRKEVFSQDHCYPEEGNLLHLRKMPGRLPCAKSHATHAGTRTHRNTFPLPSHGRGGGGGVGTRPRGRPGLAETDLHSVAAHGEGEKECPLDVAQLWGAQAARGGEKVRNGGRPTFWSCEFAPEKPGWGWKCLQAGDRLTGRGPEGFVGNVRVSRRGAGLHRPSMAGGGTGQAWRQRCSRDGGKGARAGRVHSWRGTAVKPPGVKAPGRVGRSSHGEEGRQAKELVRQIVPWFSILNIK